MLLISTKFEHNNQDKNYLNFNKAAPLSANAVLHQGGDEKMRINHDVCTVHQTTCRTCTLTN